MATQEERRQEKKNQPMDEQRKSNEKIEEEREPWNPANQGVENIKRDDVDDTEKADDFNRRKAS